MISIGADLEKFKCKCSVSLDFFPSSPVWWVTGTGQVIPVTACYSPNELASHSTLFLTWDNTYLLHDKIPNCMSFRINLHILLKYFLSSYLTWIELISLSDEHCSCSGIPCTNVLYWIFQLSLHMQPYYFWYLWEVVISLSPSEWDQRSM